MNFYSLDARASCRLVTLTALRLLASCLALAACSVESVQPTTNVTPDGGSETDRDPQEPSKETDGGRDAAAPKKDGGSTPGPTTSTFQIIDPSYENTIGVGGRFYYTITFTLENTSSADVTSLDTLTYRFLHGDGGEVTLTEPACNGKFALPAGKKTSITTQIGVDDSRKLVNYANSCGPTQYFGGATGTAPATGLYNGLITIIVGGKTSTGTFTGTLSVTGG